MNSIKKIIVANWKMNPLTLIEAEDLYRNSGEAIICPPFVYLETLSRIGSSMLGAQDCHWEDEGAFTGEVSPKMLKNLGVKYVIIGHSERRMLGETDEVVNKKLKAALRNELMPIVCLGERVRDENFKEFLKDQVEKTFAGLSTDEIGKCLIAYEPVWTISTTLGARPDTPENALESISIIKNILNSKFQILNSVFLYGGSVTSKNVRDFISRPEIAGALIGGASVDQEEFKKIMEIVFSFQ